MPLILERGLVFGLWNLVNCPRRVSQTSSGKLIWCSAQQHPDTQVIGFDLSPCSPPKFVPCPYRLKTSHTDPLNPAPLPTAPSSPTTPKRTGLSPKSSTTSMAAP